MCRCGAWTLLAIWAMFGMSLLQGEAQSPTPNRFYRVAQQQGVWWFIAPDGRQLFSLGVDCTDQGASARDYHVDKPAYAAFQHYATEAEWAKTTLTRLRSWGFNTLGGWSDTDALRRVPGETMPYTLVLHLGGATRAPWCDLFSDDIARQFDDFARKQILPVRDDPRLLGYFTDNELGWWGDTLFLYFLKEKPSNATHRVLVSLLRKRYHNDFATLQKDFETKAAHTFSDLDKGATLTLRPGGHGMEVVNAFVSRLAERYYQIAYAAVRHYDKNHLILGDRYAGYCPPEVARAARNYVDVVSTNYGADWLDGSNARFFLKMLHEATGKPVLVTEYYFCATDNRSGNKNTGHIFPTVPTQAERAAGFRTQTAAFASVPYVIGAHWFQYTDEPSNGRGDGEDYNMGLVDIHDQPYEGLTRAAATLKTEELHQKASTAHVTPVMIPSAPAEPMAGLRGWNKIAAFVPTSDTEPCADLYACWDANHLYLAVHAAEFVDDSFYAGGNIPVAERMTWEIVPGAGKSPVRVRFGPGGEAVVEGTAVPHRQWSGSTRFTAIVELPASFFGKPAFMAGDAIPLRATLARHSRAERMAWKQAVILAR